MKALTSVESVESVVGSPPGMQRRLLFNQIALTSLSTVILTVFGIVNAVLTARLLGPQGKGTLDALFLIPALVPSIGLFSISTGLIYYVGVDREKRSEYQVAALAFGCILALIYLAVAVVFHRGLWDLVLHEVEPIRSLLFVMVFSIPAYTANATAQGILLSERRMLYYNLANTAFPIVKSVLLVVLLLSMASIAQRVIWAARLEIACLLVSSLVLIRGLQKTLIWRPIEVSALRRMLRFSLKEYWGSVLQKLNYTLDKLLIALFLTKLDLGLYGLAVMLAQFLWIIPAAVTPILLSHTAGSRTAEDDRLSYLIARIALWTSVGGGVILAVTASLLIRSVFGLEFLPALPSMLILLPGAIAAGYLKVIVRILTGKGHPLADSIGSGISFVVTIVLLYLFLPTYGIVGAALASTASYSIYLVFVILYASKRMGLRVYPDMVFLKSDLDRLPAVSKLLRRIRMQIGLFLV